MTTPSAIAMYFAFRIMVVSRICSPPQEPR
jgi:hypothetical protein